VALEAGKMKLKDPSLLRSQAYINGAWIDAADGRVFAVNNPADGSLIAEVADLGADSITAAIDAAVPAQKAWAATPAKTRAMILRRWYDLVIENTDDLATILTTEMGKPLAEARGEVAYGASFIDWFAEEGRRISGDILQPHMTDKRLMVLKQPIGVVAKTV
jgi:succinate-semialdehyde dehydrogenase/glutarate-semialdehyde dehydrogenase